MQQVEVQRERQAQRHYEETRPVTVCVSSPQFNYYQPYLFTLDVCNCLPSVEQELGLGGFILWGLLSPMLRSNFVCNINETIEQCLGGKFILDPGRFF